MQKEPVYSDEEIIKTLENKRYIKIEPICFECTTNVLRTIVQWFPKAKCNIEYVGGDLFKLIVRV